MGVKNINKTKKENKNIIKRLYYRSQMFKGSVQSRLRNIKVRSAEIIATITTIFTILFLFNKIGMPDYVTIILTIIFAAFMFTISLTGFITRLKYSKSSFGLSITKEECLNGFYTRIKQGEIKLNTQMRSAGYSIDAFYNGRYDQPYIMSQRINKKLLDCNPYNASNIGSQIRIEYDKRKFEIVEEIKAFVPFYLQKAFGRDAHRKDNKKTRADNKQNQTNNMKKEEIPLTYNSKVLRLAKEIYPNTNTITLQKADYFQGLCTNDAVFYYIKSSRRIGTVFKGEKLLIDENDSVFLLEDSPCSNHIGVSTFAITRDRYVIFNKQGESAKYHSDMFIPSGSGALNYNDYTHYIKKGKEQFSELLIRGMEREFREECNLIKHKCSLETLVIGYTRIVERGGRPDFFGITLIDADYYQIKDCLPQCEKDQSIKEHRMVKYTVCRQLKESTDPLNGLVEGLLQFICENPKQISLHLYLTYKILKQFLEEEADKVNKIIEGYGVVEWGKKYNL